MLKSCPYCGGLHNINAQCPNKPKLIYKVRNTEIQKFRNSEVWHRKREQIKCRDNYMCTACFRNLAGTFKRLNTNELSVHHLVPLTVDFDKRLDDENLVTLCRKHHEMAESGLLNIEELRVSPRG